jgi:glyoxylase-like metal-dependent hydrolase (beta-lactamase superfamily II)
MRTFLAAVALVLFPGQAPPRYEVYAVSYGIITGFPVRALVAGADSTRTLDIQMMVWLLKDAEGRNVLVDAGFYRDKFFKNWTVRDYRRPSDAVAGVGVGPEDVSDLIITHAHWDHMDGADLFPKARVWIQREEYEYYHDPAHLANSGVDADDWAALERIKAEGRLRLVDGDGREIMPGITVYTGGRHTRASQFVAVVATAGTVVLASDNAYLYENLDQRRPIAQTWDSVSNLAAQARMKQLASDPRLIVPGHDPLVLMRFPKPGSGVARIE